MGIVEKNNTSVDSAKRLEQMFGAFLFSRKYQVLILNTAKISHFIIVVKIKRCSTYRLAIYPNNSHLNSTIYTLCL